VGGGVADKWGNRYEAWWTIWRGVLPVLRGEFDAIQVEPPDIAGEGAEFRLYGRRPAGPDEVHQCKRRHATSWTVRALDREGVLGPFGEHLRSGTQAVFASGTPSVLLTMAEKARQFTLGDWAARLNEPEGKARDELIQVWGVSEQEVHNRLTRLTVHGIEEATLRVTVVEYLAVRLEGDPKEALLRLADFVVDNLMVRLTGHRLWDFLRSEGFSPRVGQDLALSERVRTLNDRYVNGVGSTRPANLAVLARPEVDQIVQALTAPDGPRAVAVTGPPGSGKSTTLAAACSRLAELGMVVGPLRLDAADNAWTAEDLGAQASIGFGGPPARILARAAGGDPAALVVDQLDALSVLAGRGEAVLDSVREVLAQAQATENLRLLIACRSHDLSHDRRLRQLIAGGQRTGNGGSSSEDLLKVVVGDLTAQQVRDALDTLGLLPMDMPPRLQRLLANVFNLSLLANIVEDAQDHGQTEEFDLTSVRTRLDLLAEYDHRLRRRLQQTLGNDGYPTAVSRIARLLSDSGQLSLSRTAVADIPDTIDALLHEGVLAVEGTRLRFFHDEYFDYIFARQHIQLGRTAADLVRDDAQDLLRRGQVRAVLTLERQEDPPRYVLDLRTVLDPTLVRSHLRAAVLTWLTDQATVEDHELQLVLEIAANDQDPLRRQAIRVLSSQPFTRALNRHGLLAVGAGVMSNVRPHGDDQLAELVAKLDANSCAYLLFEAARHLPEEASAALLPLASDAAGATRWVGALLRTVFLAGPAAGPTTVKLFSTVVETIADHALVTWSANAGDALATPPPNQSLAQNIDAAVAAVYARDGIHALSTLAARASAPAVDAIRVWLTTAARIAKARGDVDVFGTDSPLPQGETGLDLFEASATKEPTEFAQAMTAFLVEQLELAADPRARWRPAGQPRDAAGGLRYDHIFGFGSFGHGLDDEVFRALRTALRLCASQSPEAAAPIIEQLTRTDLLTAQQLAAAAFSVCAAPLLPAALAWAGSPQVRGLDDGLTPAWAWGEVLAHVADTGTDEQRDAVTEFVVEPYRSLDLDVLNNGPTEPQSLSEEQEGRAREARELAVGQLVALSLIGRRLGTATPTAVRERLTRLEELLGPAPTTPAPDAVVYRVQSPIPDDEARAYTDPEWLTVIRTYTGEPDRRRGAWSVGGASEIATQLEAAAKAEPARFARLVIQIGPDANPVYIHGVIGAVTAVAQEVSDGDAPALLDMVRAVFSWPQQQFNQSLCSLVGALANRSLPADVIEMIAGMATTAADPLNDDLTQESEHLVVAGLNCYRGRAVNALAHLLAPAETRDDRVQRLLPTMGAVVQDPAEQVRVMLPPVIVRTYLSNIHAAVDLAERWLARASDDGLRAPELDRLAWQLLLGSPGLGVHLMQRMVGSPIPEVRTKGGLLAALAALRQVELPTGEGALSANAVLRQALDDVAARKGVAILLADLVDELPEPPEDDVQPADGVRPDRGLLVRLLNDIESEVREFAIRFAHDMTPPLTTYARLLSATATSRAFEEHPASVLHALRRLGVELPAETLELCERWLSQHAEFAGDIRTAAAGDAYYVVDLVLATHARTAVGSSERERCLTLLDRLIESGAVEADNKADDWEN